MRFAKHRGRHRAASREQVHRRRAAQDGFRRLSRCPAGQTSLASVATAITIAVPKAPMQENSTVSITTLIICTLPSCAASSQAIAKPLRDVGRKVAAAILNPGGIRFLVSVAVVQHGRSRRHFHCRRLGSGSRGADPAGQRRRSGVRKIAKQFGVDPSTVQRISRPFGDEAARVAWRASDDWLLFGADFYG